MSKDKRVMVLLTNFVQEHARSCAVRVDELDAKS